MDQDTDAVHKVEHIPSQGIMGLVVALARWVHSSFGAKSGQTESASVFAPVWDRVTTAHYLPATHPDQTTTGLVKYLGIIRLTLDAEVGLWPVYMAWLAARSSV